MTTKQDILNVLKKYNHEKIAVSLDNSKDCTGFWDSYVNDVYYILPDTGIQNADGSFRFRLDSEIKEKLNSFGECDSLELVNKSGRLLKRFAKYFKEQTGLKLDDKILGLLGDKLQYFLTQQAQTYYIDFSDVIDWKDGMFGKSCSCWWGCYSDSRDTFINGGGWAVRFYDSMDDEIGIGRTWLVPDNGILLGFNSYGIERPKVSKVLKALFAQHNIELHYQRTRIYNSCNSEIPYINDSGNSDNGFVLYPTDKEPSEEYDLDMEVEKREHCRHCGNSIDTDLGDYEIIDNDYYCSDCANKLFSLCDKCGEWYDQEDIHHVKSGSDHEYLCEYCAKREGLTLCYQCQEYTDETTEDHDGDDFCSDCAAEHLHYCEHCEAYYYENSFEDHDCPLNRDFSGLTECTEYNLHACIRSNGENHVTTVYKIDGCNGIVLFDTHTIDSDLDGWNIGHEQSGLAVKSNLSFNQAKELFQKIAPLTDWTRDSKEISDDRELMHKIYGY